MKIVTIRRDASKVCLLAMEPLAKPTNHVVVGNKCEDEFPTLVYQYRSENLFEYAL